MNVEEQIYKENILDHYKNPRNTGPLSPRTWNHRELNTSCGDSIELYVRLGSDGRVEAASFEGRGCAISQAAASMLTDAVRGMTVDELRALGQDDVMELLGIPVGPTRIKCAMLGLKTLQRGLDMHLAGN